MNIPDAAKKLLRIPFVFDTYQTIVGAPRCQHDFLSEYVHVKSGDRVLDIGCGTGASVPHLPHDIDLTGIDISPDYIETAKRRYPRRGCFLVADASDPNLEIGGPFDVAFAVGVLHHVSDNSARRLIEAALARLKPSGRLITIDPAFVDDQHLIDRFLVANDRGEFVRTREEMIELTSGLNARLELVQNMLRVPFSQIIAIMER